MLDVLPQVAPKPPGFATYETVGAISLANSPPATLGRNRDSARRDKFSKDHGKLDQQKHPPLHGRDSGYGFEEFSKDCSNAV